MFTLSPNVKIALFIAVFAIILFFILHKPNNISYNCEKGSCLQAEAGTKGEYGDETSCRSKCDTYMCTTDGSYKCKLATGDDYPGPYVSNDACEASTACKKPRYKCGETPQDMCPQTWDTGEGTYDDPVTCKAACRADKYTCDKDGGTGCVAVKATSPDYDKAKYENQNDCSIKCNWACTGGDDFGVKGSCNFCNPEDSCDNPYQTKKSCDDSCDSQGCCFYRCDKEKGCVPAYAGGDPSTGGGAEYTTLAACTTGCGTTTTCPENTNCYLITPGVDDEGTGYVNPDPGSGPVQTAVGSVDSAVYNCLSGSGTAVLKYAVYNPDPDGDNDTYSVAINGATVCSNEFGAFCDTLPCTITLTVIQDGITVPVDTITMFGDNADMQIVVVTGHSTRNFSDFIKIVTNGNAYTLQITRPTPTNSVSFLYGY